MASPTDPGSRSIASPEAADSGFISWAERVEATFLAASRSSEVHDRRYRIGGHAIRMLFAGDAAHERLTRTFAHLETPADHEPELTVRLWDSATTGVAAPPVPPVEPDEDAPGAMYHLDDGRIKAVYQPGPQVLSVLDEGLDAAWYWMQDAATIPFWDCAAPIRQILHWWLGSRGIQQVHGGAVGTSSGGVLLVGQPGSGKSTCSLASLGSELLYAGDDYVAVGLEPEPRVHSLYCSGKLELDHAQRFPQLLPWVSNADKPGDEKAVIYAHESHPGGTTPGFPLKAVVVPRVVGGRETTITKAPRVAALAALAPSTIIQLHVPREGAFSTMRQLIESVPCYGLALGNDIRDIPKRIGELLLRLDDGTAP